MALSKRKESFIVAALTLLAALIFMLMIKHGMGEKTRQAAAVSQQTEQCLNDPRACAGAFVVWTGAGRVLRLGNCSGEDCGVGEIPIEWLNLAKTSDEERERFPYDRIVFRSDRPAWYQTALKFQLQFITHG